MTRLLLVTLFLLMGLVSPALAQPETPESTREVSFNVFLDNNPVGTHVFTIQHQDKQILVDSNMQLEGKFWGLLPFKYTHQSTEKWQNDCLVSLQSQTLKRGKMINVLAHSDEAGLSIVRDDKAEVVAGCVKSFAYWDNTKLRGDQLLNTENGVLVKVEIAQTYQQKDGRTSLLIQSPEANINLEYSASGEWLSLKSKLEVGGLLHYIRQ